MEMIVGVSFFQYIKDKLHVCFGPMPKTGEKWIIEIPGFPPCYVKVLSATEERVRYILSGGTGQIRTLPLAQFKGSYRRCK